MSIKLVSSISERLRDDLFAGCVSFILFERWLVRQLVSIQIAAQTLVQKKDYGLAVSYCISAEDWVGLGQVVDRVLDEYIINGLCYLKIFRFAANMLNFEGPQIFSQYAVAIAPSAQKLRTPKGHGLSVHRLVFAVQYAHLHELFERHEYQEAANRIVSIFSQDVVPKSWWAIVLCDAVQLLEYGNKKDSRHHSLAAQRHTFRSITAIFVFQCILYASKT
jgi:nuclear pore complex protein Nup85